MDNIKRSRNLAVMQQHEVIDTSSSLYSGTYSDYDDRWDLKKFKKQLEMHVIRCDNTEMEFDIISIDPSIVNAFRRILLSEVPSMAIEKVFMYNNTSVIPDEVLAHRLGLIPLKADPRKFEYRQEGDLHGTEQDTLEFELKVRCSWNPDKSAESTDPDELYINHKGLIKRMTFTFGTQAQK
ncbi:DNA-directed RNA polymerases I and III subunit RPAC1 [Folsomia candida]|uniref:DNA-directed RNA polymerases I and III subunit RPAC1 n=1 Tax=Folsomia candida TaxID=158441 RepID=A0A226DBA3_FOLCA|nr:DNA-directed RNA polymerases I and III subunit RPAC1 [Folsomia candida]